MAPPAPGNDYNFIMNPEKPKKRGLLSGTGGDPFITKIVLIVGGALVLIVVTTLAVNLFFGGRNNTALLIGLAQDQQEILRLSAEGENAGSQDIKNAAISTQLSVKSHQRSWLSVLEGRGRGASAEELALKKDSAADGKLELAGQTGTFDTTYTAVMRSGLGEYAEALRSIHQNTSDQELRAALSRQYDEVQLLLEQWPQQ